VRRAGHLGWDGYSVRWAASHGGVDPRLSMPPVQLWLRSSYLTGRALAALGVSPGAVTLAGVLLALAVPLVAVWGGLALPVAAVLVVLSALADSSDGAVAVLTERTSRLGAFDDSAADRVSEAAWLIGLWLVGAPGVLATGCGGLAWLHEYLRARAGAVGMKGIGIVTMAERPTRVISVTVAFLVGGAAGLIDERLTPGAVAVVLVIWALLGLFGTFKLYRAIRDDLLG
jgi:phosphatidylglycerophosphate synthase